MILNSYNLEAFAVVARIGNFTRAAKLLNITQSALSQRIQNLEAEIGTTLIIRDRMGIRLTDGGKILFRYCQTKDQIESQALEQIKGSGSDPISGIIRIGGYSSVMRSVILPAIASLLRAHPKLRIAFFSKELRELTAMFKSGEIDFLIYNEKIVQEGISHKVLGSEQNVLIQKKSYTGPEVYLDHDEEDRTTLEYFKKKTFSGLDRQYLDDIYGIIEGVRMGIGKAVVPRHLAKKYSDIVVLDPEKFISNPVAVHYYEQNFYSKTHEKVLETLVGKCERYL